MSDSDMSMAWKAVLALGLGITHRLAGSAVVLLALLLWVRRDAPAPPAHESGLPAEYLGRWYFQSTSGGIEGREVAVADGSWIVITDAAIERYSADGRLESTEALDLTRGRSIFSGKEAWLLQGPDSNERVLEVHSQGVLTISDNAYDGFGSRYTRSR